MKFPVRQDAPDDACRACLASDRREFFRDAAAAVAGVFAALGLSPEHAHALPLRTVAGILAGAQEVAFPIPAQDGVSIDNDRDVILARFAGAVYAFSLACPHQRTALKWREQDGRFQCPKHKSKYRPDGTFISGRATRSMDRFPIRRDGGNVMVDLSRRLREDQNRDAWNAAVLRV